MEAINNAITVLHTLEAKVDFLLAVMHAGYIDTTKITGGFVGTSPGVVTIIRPCVYFAFCNLISILIIWFPKLFGTSLRPDELRYKLLLSFCTFYGWDLSLGSHLILVNEGYGLLVGVMLLVVSTPMFIFSAHLINQHDYNTYHRAEKKKCGDPNSVDDEPWWSNV